MDSFDFKRGGRIHFIGIGGISMSALAEILHNQGCTVSGSNDKLNDPVKHLRDIGIRVDIGHDEAHITDDIELIVYTVAVKGDNPELCAGRAKNKRIIDRAELLGMLMNRYKYSVAISGSHGKTTTTSFISDILINSSNDPTIMIGGNLRSTDSNMRCGSSEYFIAEADEYFDSFLKFYPYVGVILNVDFDHPDFFESYEHIVNSFHRFAGNIAPDGALVMYRSAKDFDRITDSLNCRVITYDIENEEADWRAGGIIFDAEGMPEFDIIYRGEVKGRLQIKRNGTHNILNALAAIAACSDLGISIDDIMSGLAGSLGSKRRYEYKGMLNGVTIIDDYAHHPAEIKTMLAAAKRASHNKLWCVFQPHTYSRTKALLPEFIEAFDDADKIIIMDIFSARPSEMEKNAGLIHSRDLAEGIKLRGKEAYYFPSFADAEKFLLNNCVPDDMLITVGAGDIYLLGEELLNTDLSTLSTVLSTSIHNM